MCQWDKWANPTNTKSDAYWNKFVGYQGYKNGLLQNLGTTVNNTLYGVTNILGNTVGGLLGGLGLF